METCGNHCDAESKKAAVCTDESESVGESCNSRSGAEGLGRQDGEDGQNKMALSVPESKRRKEFVLKRALDVSFVPENQRRWQPECDIESGTKISCTYGRISRLILSQEQRLLVRGKIRSKPGYDLDDPFFNHTKDTLESGAPVVVVGTGQPAAYLKPCSGGLHVLKILGSGVLEKARNDFLALPTREPKIGEWCLVVGSGPMLSPWHGIRGVCGTNVQNSKTVGLGYCHWVTFETGSEFSQTPVALLPLKHLAALPLPPPGSPVAPLEALMAPREVLPPLLESEASVLSGVGCESIVRDASLGALAIQHPGPPCSEGSLSIADTSCGTSAATARSSTDVPLTSVFAPRVKHKQQDGEVKLGRLATAGSGESDCSTPVVRSDHSRLALHEDSHASKRRRLRPIRDWEVIA